MSTAGALGDFRSSELATAVFFAFAVLTGSAFALEASALDQPAMVSEIDRNTAIPVRIVPVLDLDMPLLKLGGQRDTSKLPDRWVRKQPKARAEQKAFVSTKAGKTAADVPAPDLKVASAHEKPPPPEAEITKHVDTPLTAVVDAGPPSNVNTPGHADGVKEGTETDPLKARAVDLYRDRIRGWFSGRFRVSGSGLSEDQITKVRVGAIVQLSGDHRVTGYAITPSGNATFDAAARTMLEGTKGLQIPPPPDNYPDLGQDHIQITLVCSRKQCD